MKLATRHYQREVEGKPTLTGKALRFFNRKGYYEGMAKKLGGPAAERLELIDRRAREAALLCPRDAGDAFWQFLNGAKTADLLGERIRIMQEFVLQFRVKGKEFHGYSFSVMERVGELLRAFAQGLPDTAAQARDYHPVLAFTYSTQQFRMPAVLRIQASENPSVSMGLDESQVQTYPGLMCTAMSITTVASTNYEQKVDIGQWDSLVKKARSLAYMFDPN